MASPALVLAVHDDGLLELDGNVADDPDPGTDWAALFTAEGEELDPGDPFLVSDFVPDAATPDLSYHAGSDKDIDELNTWECTSVNNPTTKDDILNAYVALFENADGDLIAYFGFERPSNNGNSFMGLWFLEGLRGCSQGSDKTGSFGGTHGTDDMLVLHNFVNGGSKANFKVYAWDPAASNNLRELASAGSCTTAPNDDVACGRVNDGPLTTPWQPGATTPLGSNQFFEGGINLGDLGIEELPCFTTLLAETRTSQSITAQLKDFARGLIQTCDARISIEPQDAENPVRSTHQLNITVETQQGVNAPWEPSEGQLVTATIVSGPGHFVDDVNTCTTGADGRCSVFITSNVAGDTVVKAAVDVDFDGEVLHVETDGTDGSSPPAVKHWFCPPAVESLAGALGAGDALPADIRILDITVPGLLPQPVPPVSSSQTVPGSSGAADAYQTLDVPGILHVDLLPASSTSTVGDAPGGFAESRGMAEVAHVDVLDGLVTADAVLSQAFAHADARGSGFSAEGSTFTNLHVDGVALVDVKPNTRVDLPDAVFGPGSYVMLFEQFGATGRPSVDQIVGAQFTADLEVNMIRVHITDVLALGLNSPDPAVDIIIAHSAAQAAFDQFPLCFPGPIQSVSGHAFTLRVDTTPDLLPPTIPLTEGFADIPETGGLGEEHYLEAAVPDTTGTTANAAAADSVSAGSIADNTTSTAASTATVAHVCVLVSDKGDCEIGADLIIADASATADAGGASAAGGAQFVNLVVLDMPVCLDVLGIDDTCRPEPNTQIELPLGLGTLWLNRQVADASAPGHAGLTVQAIYLETTIPMMPEVTVAEAHADATWLPPPP
ncbi:MAG TPA: choice-of-anchor P family protein [Candidatus Thermoplasmatota archaeon]|nr:choice-of-anchor P family protein [Candidatus Thermoplasmatota archaeon]